MYKYYGPCGAITNNRRQRKETQQQAAGTKWRIKLRNAPRFCATVTERVTNSEWKGRRGLRKRLYDFRNGGPPYCNRCGDLNARKRLLFRCSDLHTLDLHKPQMETILREGRKAWGGGGRGATLCLFAFEKCSHLAIKTIQWFLFTTRVVQTVFYYFIVLFFFLFMLVVIYGSWMNVSSKAVAASHWCSMEDSLGMQKLLDAVDSTYSATSSSQSPTGQKEANDDHHCFYFLHSLLSFSLQVFKKQNKKK